MRERIKRPQLEDLVGDSSRQRRRSPVLVCLPGYLRQPGRQARLAPCYGEGSRGSAREVTRQAAWALSSCCLTLMHSLIQKTNHVKTGGRSRGWSHGGGRPALTWAAVTLSRKRTLGAGHLPAFSQAPRPRDLPTTCVPRGITWGCDCRLKNWTRKKKTWSCANTCSRAWTPLYSHSLWPLCTFTPATGRAEAGERRLTGYHPPRERCCRGSAHSEARPGCPTQQVLTEGPASQWPALWRDMGRQRQAPHRLPAAPRQAPQPLREGESRRRAHLSLPEDGRCGEWETQAWGGQAAGMPR